MRTTAKYYIGERFNPQLAKPYYVAYGKISKTDVKKAENCVYGSMRLTSYDNIEDYNKDLEKLKEEGFKVNYR